MRWWNLDGKLFHGGVKSSLVARKISGDGVVEKEKLLLHHLESYLHKDEHSNSKKSHLYSVLIQELQFDLNVGAELLKLCLLVVEAGQGLRLL